VTQTVSEFAPTSLRAKGNEMPTTAPGMDRSQAAPTGVATILMMTCRHPNSLCRS
jgi:hypothetical protein